MTSSGSRVPGPSAAGGRSVRAHFSGWRRSSSHAYACHAGRLVVVRVVRVLRFPTGSYSSVVTVSRWSPLAMRAIWLSHSTSVAASAFLCCRKSRNTGTVERRGPPRVGSCPFGRTRLCRVPIARSSFCRSRARPLIAASPTASALLSGQLSPHRCAEPLVGAQQFVGSPGCASAGVGGVQAL